MERNEKLLCYSYLYVSVYICALRVISFSERCLVRLGESREKNKLILYGLLVNIVSLPSSSTAIIILHICRKRVKADEIFKKGEKKERDMDSYMEIFKHIHNSIHSFY